MKIPLQELWDESGALPLKRGRLVSASDIKDELRTGLVRFAVADVGLPLRWCEGDERFGLWKKELAPRLVDPADAASGFVLESYPGGYCYIASEWLDEQRPAVVLFEKHH